MLSLSCAPSGAGSSGGGSPSSRASTAGATLASTRRAGTEPPSKNTSAPTPSVSIEVTSHPSRTSAPAAHASAASSSVNAPIPPTGTSQSPVSLPITW